VLTRLKVLLVEDDQAMAQMCAKLIRRRGHLAVIAHTSQEAVRIVSTFDDIDVVVSDIQMPEMSGIQLLVSLREMNQTLPVILMTGYGHTVSSAQVLAMGAADYLIKPFEPDTFLTCLERATRSDQCSILNSQFSSEGE
jgi:DNA-binding NtrC family response regulator